MNDANFKAFTADQEDYFENQYKLGNAYISAPLNDNLSITFVKYIQSQGVTALLPIGVNVVNPVNLPLLRSPGAQLKDALLPQAMVGVSAYLDGGVTLDAYYQLEQKEIELDALDHSMVVILLESIQAQTCLILKLQRKQIRPICWKLS